jgi:dTDP-4-dehydrorhamnose reductase
MEAVEAATECLAAGIPFEGVTAWSAFGAFEWSSILRNPSGSYATGCFDIRADGQPQLTPLGAAVRATAAGQSIRWWPGWWRRPERALHNLGAAQQAA